MEYLTKINKLLERNRQKAEICDECNFSLGSEETAEGGFLPAPATGDDIGSINTEMTVM